MSLTKRSKRLYSRTISKAKRTLERFKSLRRRLGIFEVLEVRLPFSADSIDGRPYIDLGPSDNVAWDQPRVTMQLIQPSDDQPIGPDIFSTFLLDTGANTILTFQSAVNDMNETPPPYRTEGSFEEVGVGGSSLYDISAAYQIDYAGGSGERNTIPLGRIISDDTRDLSIFGPWGITGMPAMTEKVTTLDFTTFKDPDVITMQANFSDTLPAYNGPRYSIPVDNRISFSPEGSVVTGSPPVWAHLPFLTAQLKQDNNVATGNFLFDTGAQVSIMSTKMAKQLGLDSNLDGVLDSKDANYARDETIGGIGGLETVPVFLVDQLHVPTSQGVDLVWTDLQWLILDIIPGIDAIFGFDNQTSGWIEALSTENQSGYVLQQQLDFRNWKATNKGNIYYDLNPEVVSVVNPNGPGAIVVENGGNTSVAEGGANDSYTLALSKQPTADVRVNLAPAISGQVTAVNAASPTKTYLDFTPSNWNIPQTVLVSAVNDTVAEGFQRSFVKNVPTSTDPQYQNVGMPRVIVNVIDNDAPGIMIMPTNGSTDVEEGGATDNYFVVLTYPPTQPVTLDLENRQNQVKAVATNGGATSLVFTPANWNVPQSVTVTAVDDTLIEGPHKTFISQIMSTSDAQYTEFAASLQETVFIKDNDQPDVTGPSITDVIVGSTKWSSSFIDMVDGGGVGSGNRLGISLPGKNQLTAQSQAGINKIYIKFSENVGASIAASKISLLGSKGGNYMSRATFAYGVDGANILTITLPSQINKDALILSLADSITDAAGNRLDGEWRDGTSTTSGNGSNNGQFNFRMNFLSGDVNNSNTVNGKDLQLAQAKNGKAIKTLADTVYDVDGSGAIDNADMLLISRMSGSVLPSAPNPPTLSRAPSSSGSTKGTGSNQQTGSATSSIITPDYISLENGSVTDRYNQLMLKKQRLSELPRVTGKTTTVFPGLINNPFISSLPLGSISIGTAANIQGLMSNSWNTLQGSFGNRESTPVLGHQDSKAIDPSQIDLYMEKVGRTDNSQWSDENNGTNLVTKPITRAKWTWRTLLASN